MIDTSNIKKETSKHEEYAIQWFNDNGFTGKVLHQWVSETAFEVERDGVTDSFRLTYTMQDPRKCDIASYMEQFRKSFELKKQLVELRRLVHKEG